MATSRCVVASRWTAAVERELKPEVQRGVLIMQQSCLLFTVSTISGGALVEAGVVLISKRLTIAVYRFS